MPLSTDGLVAQYQHYGIKRGQKLAVGVSGGADSLCLLLLTAPAFAVTAITVDHALRPEAAAEAKFVAEVCHTHGINHVTLRWDGDKPTANIQAEAREARYELMRHWCHDNDVSFLAVGHHMDDQAETLLLRLARGSGVYGLAGMAATRDLGDGVSLVRPLLGYRKTEVIEALETLGQSWIDDPSNKLTKFDRVQIRALLANPPVDGLTVERLAATADRMRRTRHALEHYETVWLKKAIQLAPEGYVMLRFSELQGAPEETVLRGLSSLCRYISGGNYVPRMEKLMRLYTALLKNNFKGQTLYGAQFSPFNESHVLITRELSAVRDEIYLDKSAIWDNRFAIHAKGDISGLKVSVLGEGGWSKLKAAMPDFDQVSAPRLACLTLPAIYKGSELQAVPHLGYNTHETGIFEVFPSRSILNKSELEFGSPSCI